MNTPAVNWHSELGSPHPRIHINALIFIVISGLLLRLYSLYVGQAYHYSALNDEIAGIDYALFTALGHAEQRIL